MSYMNKIYPKELILNLENKDDQQATFLDLDIKISENCLQVKTYDKRDDFKFEIISYPDLSGNIPAQPAYGVFISQIIRYSRICNFQQDIVDKGQTLMKKLIKKDYTMEGIKQALRKCFRTLPPWIKKKLGDPQKMLDGHLINDCWNANIIIHCYYV